jgi:hypothetical protein
VNFRLRKEGRRWAPNKANECVAHHFCLSGWLGEVYRLFKALWSLANCSYSDASVIFCNSRSTGMIFWLIHVWEWLRSKTKIVRLNKEKNRDFSRRSFLIKNNALRRIKSFNCELYPLPCSNCELYPLLFCSTVSYTHYLFTQLWAIPTTLALFSCLITDQLTELWAIPTTYCELYPLLFGLTVSYTHYLNRAIAYFLTQLIPSTEIRAI